jgi:hypothetical protein
MERTARAPGDVAVIVAFALLLLAPALLALTGHAGFDVAFLQNTEHRRPFVAPPPTSGALATGGWERDAERELADAFPLRKQLIQSYDYAKYAWLGDIRSDAVIRGRDGWLFLGGEERAYLTDRVNPTDAVLAHVADVYAARAAWCKQRGIRYVFVLAPNKSTIYPQYLPPSITRVTPTPADRLIPMLRARGVAVVDVRETLIHAAHSDEVYSKGDTHWNDLGALVAYRSLVKSLRDAGVRDWVPDKSVSAHLTDQDGDLLGMAGITGLVRNEWVKVRIPPQARPIAAPDYPNDPLLPAFDRHAYEVDNPNVRGTAVFFGDSFSQALIPFLADDFRRTVHLTHQTLVQFDRHVVTAEHPTVVIDEQVERGLVNGAQFTP